MMQTTLLNALLADGLMLVSPWKPVLFVLTVALWAWVVATIYDKDAGRWYFKREAWNIAHMLFGLVAVVAFLAIPLMFWITWPIMIAILGFDLGLYAFLRNRDDRVPESNKWSLDFEKMAAARAESKAAKGKKSAKAARGVTLTIHGKKGTLDIPEDRESPEYALRVTADEILVDAMTSRATQLDIAPVKQDTYAATKIVDSVREVIRPLPASEAVAVIDLLKSAAGMDVNDRRRKLRGKLEVGAHGTTMTPAKLVTLGAAGGMRLSMEFDPETQNQRRLKDLGLLDEQLETLEQIVNEGQGVVLLTGPSDQGRTNTLYALLRAHDAYTSNVQSLELEVIEASLEGVRQNIFNPTEDGAEFGTTTRSILRRDPSVLGVAELPDEATAQEISRADHERTRVYLSFKADNVLRAIQLYARAVGDQKKAAESLHGVLNQRLVRKLCENCRVAVQPQPEMLKKLGLPADTKQIFRKGGQVLVKDKPETCPVCEGAGFMGVIGLFEIHRIGAEERRLIASNDLTGLQALFRQHREPSLQGAGLQRVREGDTSVEEVARVTTPPKSKSGSGGGSSARPAAPQNA